MFVAMKVALQSDTAEGNQNCDRPAKSRLVSKLSLRLNLCWCSFAVQFHLARLHWVCRFSLADTLLDFKFPEGWPDLSINALLLDVVPSREAIPTLCQSRLLGCRGKRKSLRFSSCNRGSFNSSSLSRVRLSGMYIKLDCLAVAVKGRVCGILFLQSWWP